MEALHPRLQKLFSYAPPDTIPIPASLEKLFDQIVPEPPELAVGTALAKEQHIYQLLFSDIDNCGLDLSDERTAFLLVYSWPCPALKRILSEDILSHPFLSLLLVSRSPRLIPLYFELGYPFFDLINPVFLKIFFEDALTENFQIKKLIQEYINIHTIEISWSYLKEMLSYSQQVELIWEWLRKAFLTTANQQILAFVQKIHSVIPRQVLYSTDIQQKWLTDILDIAETDSKIDVNIVIDSLKLLWSSSCYLNPAFNRLVIQLDRGGMMGSSTPGDRDVTEQIIALRSGGATKVARDKKAFGPIVREILLSGPTTADVKLARSTEFTFFYSYYKQYLRPLVTLDRKENLRWLIEHSPPAHNCCEALRTLLIEIAMLSPELALCLVIRDCRVRRVNKLDGSLKYHLYDEIAIRQRLDILEALKQRYCMQEPISGKFLANYYNQTLLTASEYISALEFGLQYYTFAEESTLLDSNLIRRYSFEELETTYLGRCLYVLGCIWDGRPEVVVKVIPMFNELIDEHGCFKSKYDRLRKPIWLAAIKSRKHLGSRLLKETSLSPKVKGKPLAEYAHQYSRLNMYRLLKSWRWNA